MLAQLVCSTFFTLHRTFKPLKEKHRVNVFHLIELGKAFVVVEYWLTVKAYWEP